MLKPVQTTHFEDKHTQGFERYRLCCGWSKVQVLPGAKSENAKNVL